MKRMQKVLVAIGAVLAIAGCAYPYYPYGYPAPVASDPFEMPWNAAMGAMGDGRMGR